MCSFTGDIDPAVICLQMIRAADPETRPQVLEILDSAQSLGLKVLRMWAFDEGPMQYNTLQRYPGQLLATYSQRSQICVCCSAVSGHSQSTSCQNTLFHASALAVSLSALHELAVQL